MLSEELGRQRFQIKKWDDRWWVIPHPFTPNIGIRGPFRAWIEAVMETKRLAAQIEVKA